jgi:peptide/nickel transport system substrate-binding protein
MIRFNFLNPPYDNPAIRRAALSAVSQADVMTAVAGTDHAMWRDGVGFFLPGSALASTEGVQAVSGPRDLEASRRMLAASDYKGEPLVLMAPSDIATAYAQGAVVADAWKKIGFNVDLQSPDWGTVLQRLANRGPIDKGGWNAFSNFTLGVNTFNPAAHNYIRGSGKNATFGWADIPELERLRTAWFDAPDVPAQREICRQMQLVAFETVPYVPTGIFYQPTAYHKTLSGVLKGLPLFYNVRKS